MRWAPNHPVIIAAEQRHGLPPGSLGALMVVESGGNPAARSPTGVVGLFQVTRRTGAAYGMRDRTDPVENTEVAARHLRDLLDRSGGNLALALTRYKGPEISDASYLQRYGRAWKESSMMDPSMFSLMGNQEPYPLMAAPASSNVSLLDRGAMGQEAGADADALARTQGTLDWSRKLEGEPTRNDGMQYFMALAQLGAAVGAAIAASKRKKGKGVTVIGSDTQPMQRGMGNVSTGQDWMRYLPGAE